MYGTYKLPTYRQNSQTRQKGREILTQPFYFNGKHRATHSDLSE